MAFTKAQIVTAIETTGMIPVFYYADAETAQQVIDAAYAGGVKVFEFTNRGENAFPVFQQLVRYIAKYPDAMLGIGTIMDGNSARKFIDAGAHFVVSPILKLEIATVCHAHDILWIPGCATLTEIVTGKEAGAEIIKLFPGSVLGPAFVSAVMPVVPGLKLMPTGGVEPTDKNLSAWFNAGVVCVGMGSQLITKQVLAEKSWAQLTENVQEALAIIRRLKK